MRGQDFEAFFQRLRQATDIDTQAQLARVLGVGRAAVSLVKKKGAVPARWILDLSARYDLDPLWLDLGQGSPKGDDDFTRVPKVAARLSAGGGSFETQAEVEGHFAFRSDWLHQKGSPTNMVLMSVVGNSMEPEIREGDLVLIDQSKVDVYAGGIYAVGVEDTVLVKRLEKLPGTLVLHSDNRDYEPIHLSGDELLNVRVIGKVLWTARDYH